MRTLDLQPLISETQKTKVKARLKAVLAPATGTHKLIVILTVSASALCVGLTVPQAVDGVGFFAPLVISTGLCVLVTFQANWWPKSWRLTREAAMGDDGRRAPDGDSSAGWSAGAAEEKSDGKLENWQVDLMAESAWNDHFGQYTTWHYETVER